jgi:phytoene dehydrogenase-like protein
MWVRRRLRELGGDIRCGGRVESVAIRAGPVAGVRVRGGQELRAGAVVLTVSAGPSAALLPADALPGRLTARLRRWRYGLGTSKVDFALAEPVPWTNPAVRRAGVVHIGDTLPALFRSQQEAAAGRTPAEPAMVVGQHSLHDASRAPTGRHTLYVYTHVPQQLDVAATEVGEPHRDAARAVRTGFRGRVLAGAVRSPSDLERENPSLVGGDLAGGSCELDQILVFRPAPQAVPRAHARPGALRRQRVHPSRPWRTWRPRCRRGTGPARRPLAHPTAACPAIAA